MTLRAGINGFTLIELVIVLLLVSLATSIVVVSISVEHQKVIIRREARKLYAALKHSRETALTNRSEVRFEIYEENTGYTIASKNTKLYERSMPEGITVSSDDIIFYPMGDSTGGAIALEDDDGRKYEILVSNITGKAKIERIQSP